MSIPVLSRQRTGLLPGYMLYDLISPNHAARLREAAAKPVAKPAVTLDHALAEVEAGLHPAVDGQKRGSSSR